MGVASLYDVCLWTVARLSETHGWGLVKDLPHHVLSDLIDHLPICCLNDFHDHLKVIGVDSQRTWIKHYRKRYKINGYSRRKEFLFSLRDVNDIDWRQRYLDHCSNILLRQIVQQRVTAPDDGNMNERIVEVLKDPLHLMQSGCVARKLSSSKYSPKAIKIWGSTCDILAKNSVAQDILADTVEEVTFEHQVFPSQAESVFELICTLLKQGRVHTINFKDVKSPFLNDFLKCLQSRKQNSSSHNRHVESNRRLELEPRVRSGLSLLKKVSLVGVSLQSVNLDILNHLFLYMDGLVQLDLIDNDISSNMDILNDLGLHTNNGQRLPSIINYERNIIAGCFETFQEIIRHQGLTETSHCVTHLSLEFCSMTTLQLSRLFSIVSENKNIIFLSVFGNQANSIQPSLLKLFQNGCLQGLDLGQTKFTLTGHGVTTVFVNELLSTMMASKSLRYLGLASTMLSDSCLFKLAIWMTDESFDSGLDRIDISFNNQISSEGLRSFGEELLQSFKPTKLTRLRLQHNYNSGLESSYFKDLLNVVHVDLAGPSEDTDTDFTEHVANM